MDQSAAPWRVVEDRETHQNLVAGPAARLDGGQRSRRMLPFITSVAAAVLVAAAIVIAAGSHPALEIAGAVPIGSGSLGGGGDPPRSPSTGGSLVVDVQGAVLRPGVVRLPVGSRVGDAIAAAGGYGPRVAAERLSRALNLAALVKDGDQVVVPSRDDASIPLVGSGGSGSSGASGSGGPSTPVDLNRATAAELDALPGIGPVTATKIIASRDERPFASIDDLRTRKLVGSATFDKIKDLVVVR
jgi:competence protein ComEA